MGNGRSTTTPTDGVGLGRGVALRDTAALRKGECSDRQVFLLPTNKRNRWCGKGLYYCSAPDCQINYGTGCDGVCVPYLLSLRV